MEAEVEMCFCLIVRGPSAYRGPPLAYPRSREGTQNLFFPPCHRARKVVQTSTRPREALGGLVCKGQGVRAERDRDIEMRTFFKQQIKNGYMYGGVGRGATNVSWHLC